MIRSGFGYAAFKEQILRENELFGRHQVEQANKLVPSPLKRSGKPTRLACHPR
jgi:hypothetical protein